MTGRMTGKTAVVVGAGQSPGANVGNGRATALLLAREGAQVMCVDRDEASAAETVANGAATAARDSRKPVRRLLTKPSQIWCARKRGRADGVVWFGCAGLSPPLT